MRAESTKCTERRRDMSSFLRRGITVDNAALAVVSFATIALFGEAAARTDLGDAQGARDSRYPPLSSIVTEGKICSKSDYFYSSPINEPEQKTTFGNSRKITWLSSTMCCQRQN